MVDVGGVVFFSHMVYPGPAGHRTRITDNIDYPFLGILAFIGLHRPDVRHASCTSLADKPPKNEMQEIRRSLRRACCSRSRERGEKKDKPSGNPDAGEGAKAKREEGKVGKKDAKMQKAKGNKVEMQEAGARQVRSRRTPVFSAPCATAPATSTAASASSGLDADITGGIGGLIGAKGTQIGSGGLGSRGSGLGGGGTAEGLGGLGTKGIGSGASGYGSGGGSLR